MVALEFPTPRNSPSMFSNGLGSWSPPLASVSLLTQNFFGVRSIDLSLAQMSVATCLSQFPGLFPGVDLHGHLLAVPRTQPRPFLSAFWDFASFPVLHFFVFLAHCLI